MPESARSFSQACENNKNPVFKVLREELTGVDTVLELGSGTGQHAPTRNRLCVYGPFNYRGSYTGDSNARFDQWLALQNPHSAIRDFEQVDAPARQTGYRLQADHGMPANNRLLVWQKLSMVTVPA